MCVLRWPRVYRVHCEMVRRCSRSMNNYVIAEWAISRLSLSFFWTHFSSSPSSPRLLMLPTTPRPMLLQTVSVDIDLGAEASSSQLCRVSRRHALIKLKCDGEFYIKNIGKRPLDVNGRPVWRGTKCRLPHDSVIEIANIFLLFSINTPTMAKIKQQLRSSMTG